MKRLTNKQRCKKCVHRCVCNYQSYFDNVDRLGEHCNHYMPKTVPQIIKAEAYKEFADMVKLLNQKNLIIWNEQIDNLLKEMVGE